MFRCSLGVLALLVPWSTAIAQRSTTSENHSRAVAALRALPDARDSGWRAEWDASTGFARLVYGGSIAPSSRPRTEVQWLEAARSYIATLAHVHGIDEGTLLPADRAVRFLPLGRLPRGMDKVAVRFKQQAAGIEVDDGCVSVLMTAAGDLIAVQSTSSPFLEETELRAAVPADIAASIALESFVDRVGIGPSVPPPSPRLVITQTIQDGVRRPRLAWILDLWWSEYGIQPEAWRYWVDAVNGRILQEQSLVCLLDVGGTLCTWATGGTKPDTGSNPEVTTEMAYAKVEAAGGLITYTDRFGNWNFAGQSGPLSVTFTFSGMHVSVQDTSPDGNYSAVFSCDSGNGNAIVLNSVRDEFTTAEANAFVVVNVVGDYIRDIECSDVADCDDTVPDSSVVVNVNEAHCMASAGAQIHLGRMFSGCVNNSYSTIVAHELGHILNDRYGSMSGGIDESTADIWAMYTFDTEFVGEDFLGTGTYVRTGGSDNTQQFCGDEYQTCGGGDPHVAGRHWMGAAWKVREALNAQHGDALGDAVADTLFVSWMNAYGHTNAITAVFRTEWLLLDDDDLDLSNGTPNACQINEGFDAHGFPQSCVPCAL